MILEKGFSNLELEGQGRGIIIRVTHLLLLGPFYTIQTKKDKHFVGKCKNITVNRQVQINSNFFSPILAIKENNMILRIVYNLLIYQLPNIFQIKLFCLDSYCLFCFFPDKFYIMIKLNAPVAIKAQNKSGRKRL